MGRDWPRGDKGTAAPPLTVFHVDGERTLRGGERQLLYLACGLRRCGLRGVVACREGGLLDGEARRLGLERLHLPFFFEWDPASAWMLSRAARRSAPALLHAHTAHACAVSSLAGLPWVAHRRVDFRLSGAASRRLKYGSAGRIVAVSEGVRRVLASDGFEPSRVAVIHDCVPVGPEEARLAGLDEPFEPAPPRPPGPPLIGCLAALVPHKDHATLLRAAARLKASRPDARLLIAGEGPLRAGLEALAASLSLGGTVRFLGQVRGAAAFLKSLDIFVLSSWGEGMGSVLLEAMACGVPIVATSAGGIPEIVEDSRTGLLAPPRDPAALAERLLAALGDPAASRRRADAALESVKSHSMMSAARSTEALYRETMGT
jgi:glycosyltransferase involved in cell wall biosynthesis